MISVRGGHCDNSSWTTKMAFKRKVLTSVSKLLKNYYLPSKTVKEPIFLDGRKCQPKVT